MTDDCPGWSQYALCKTCGHGFNRSSRVQVNCPKCQQEHNLERVRNYNRVYRAQKAKPDIRLRIGFYTIEDPLIEWHAVLPSDQIREGMRLAIFSPGTIITHGHIQYRIIGNCAPEPFMRAGLITPQRLEEL